jgi:hypothetical protein
MTDTAELTIRSKILSEWRFTQTQLRRLNGAVVLRPRDDQQIIQPGNRTTEGVISIEVGPVVLNVPERGDHHKPRLFVYVKGFLEFSRNAWTQDKKLVTTNTQTEAAYFRADSDGNLLLVYGAHYDYARGQHGHPAFHLQLRGSLEAYAKVVQSEFRLNGNVEDGIASMLRNVRAASAQIDAFSCVLQVAADHLLPPVVTPDQRDAFNALQGRAELCSPYCQAGGPPPLPSSEPNASFRCFRARHWYARI